MKRYIRTDSIYGESRIADNLNEIEQMLKGMRYFISDDNSYIDVILPSGFTESTLMSEGMLGKWFEDHGYNVSFRTGDYEYTTKPEITNYRSMEKRKGHTAFLRNRCIMTIR